MAIIEAYPAHCLSKNFKTGSVRPLTYQRTKMGKRRRHMRRQDSEP